MFTRTAMVVVLINLAVVCGCAVQESADTAKAEKPGTAASLADNGSSLDRLREQERQQLARLDEMEQSLETDAIRMRKEQDMLRTIRSRIGEMETAETRSSQASANAMHSQQPAPPMANNRADQNPPEQRGQLYMRPVAPPRQAPVQQISQQMPPQPQVMQQPAPQQMMMMANDDIIWDPPGKLVAGPAQPQPPVPQYQAAAMQPPVQQQPVVPQSQTYQRPAPAPAPVAPAPAPAAPMPKIEDEIFRPDLFLLAET